MAKQMIIKFLKKTLGKLDRKTYPYKVPEEVSDINLYHNRQKFLEKPLPYPKVISIQPIAACNLRCVMCEYSRIDQKKSPEMMSMDTYKKIIDEIEGKVPRVGFSGMGEPMLCKYVHEMIAYATSKNIKTKMTSNGLVFTEERLHEVFQAGLTELRISIDGASSDIYEEIRVGGSFSRLIEKLELLNKVREEGEYKTRVVIHTVFQKSNIHEFHKMKPTFSKYADTLTCKLPYTFGSSDDEDFSVFPMIGPHECSLLAFVMSIHANGDVSICCNDYHGTNIVGNINKSSVGEIWNGKQYNIFRKNHFNSEYNKIKLCKNCRMTSMAAIKELRRIYDCK